MSGKRSRDKGARGEREASKYLKVLGFGAERNARNGISTDDLRLPGLPNLHVEVKFGYPLEVMDIHTKSLRDAWEQARGGCAGFMQYEETPDGSKGYWYSEQEPVVLWKPPRRPWRLTWMEPCGLVTTTGDEAIKSKLLELNGA